SSERLASSARRLWVQGSGTIGETLYPIRHTPYPLDMERRDLLKTLGAAGALALLPHEAMAAWTRVAAGFKPVGGLTEAQLALINAIADTLIPRTDTPGAVDVNVAAFIDV